MNDQLLAALENEYLFSYIRIRLNVVELLLFLRLFVRRQNILFDIGRSLQLFLRFRSDFPDLDDALFTQPVQQFAFALMQHL